MSQTNDGEHEGLVYSYRPRAVGGGLSFRLGEHSLDWNLGGTWGSTPYPMMTMLRLGYRPTNFGTRRFMAEIWSQKGPKLEIASASYRSLVALDDQGPAFKDFMRELHARIAASGGNCRFEAGFPAWRWWPMAAVGAATGAFLIYIAFSTLASGDMSAGLLMAGFIVLLAWQMWPLITRNRPRRYDPRHIPEDVIP
ncbi:MAG: hypothetical protein IT539_00655 [Bradyrhizobiaceae bacterium]|nr:hypothetical protein [Bradyrhizobiaceae bacterium]